MELSSTAGRRPTGPGVTTGVWRTGRACPACGTRLGRSFYEVRDVPVQSVLLMASREEALVCPRGDIALVCCERCGLIYNQAFDPATQQFSGRYEETQGYSPAFSQFARRQAEDLIARYDLHGKDIIEIGCGKGEFLALLCELGQNRGVGFDPAYVDERGRPDVGGGFSVIKDLYSERYVEYQADFFCCRMTLEHIAEPLALIGAVRRAIGGREGTLLLQVPSVMRILQEGAFWDIYYEHCSYYGHASLTQLLRRCAFDPIRSETVYDGQYLVMEAGPAPEGPAEEIRGKDLAALMRAIGHFAASVHARMTAWRGALGEMARNGRTAVWGSGSKAVAFLTTLGVRDEVEYVVDINPYRQGTFLPGTGQPIVAPEYLRQNPPDHVIVMNPVYRKEITGALAAMELTPRVLTP